MAEVLRPKEDVASTCPPEINKDIAWKWKQRPMSTILKLWRRRGDVASGLTAAIEGDGLNAESADSAVHDGTLPQSDNVSMPPISAASVPFISAAPPVTIPLQ